MVRIFLLFGFLVSSVLSIAATWWIRPAVAAVGKATAEKPAADLGIHGSPATDQAEARKLPPATQQVAEVNNEPSAKPPEATGGGGLFVPPFDPLDLTGEQIRVLHRSYDFARALQVREEELVAREQAVAAATLELEKRIALLEAQVSSERQRLSQEMEAKLGEREAGLKETETRQQAKESQLNRLAADMRARLDERVNKIAAVYESMKPKKAAAIFSQMDANEAATILFVLPDQLRSQIVAELDPGLAGALLKTPFAAELSAMMPDRK